MVEDNATLFSYELIREGYLWPSSDYDRQLTVLYRAIGKELFLVRLEFSDINLAVTLENRLVTLLDVIRFLVPDPARRFYPHMLILTDGRGINLGHVARLSQTQPFNTQSNQVIFQQNRLLERLLFPERRLSEETIRRTSQAQLARILGMGDRKRID